MAPEPAGRAGAPLTLRLKKSADGATVVSFVRPDGTSTTGRLGTGGFGAVHDLTHYVVESTLGFRQGFLGLVAAGRDLADFEVKHANREWPDEALVAECIVGQFTNAWFAGTAPLPDEFNWLVRAAVDAVRPGAVAPPLGAAELAAMWRQLTELTELWRAVPPGGSFSVEFALD
jgi:hypothetical protein